ncbi:MULTISPECIES: DUF4850 domain-containing protein [Acinetobacter]|uniref:DUF4850 domain-containing protein n=1 Tax=Acinetobacter TaxID=469 RepID=UPI00192AEFB3|nr:MULTISPECIES: DUF4850 domain-containing protein [Acinetobacter]MCU4369492.1 DUF4850 domain-containing protein [Acinetobacter courvalinii]MCU4447697.1 DUF4850 domain-containing protein [Acinetobacter courvalinii]
MQKSLSIHAILFTLSVTSTHAEVSTFKPIFPKFSNTAQERKAENQIYALGEVSFANDVRVPFYGVTALNPADEGLLKDFKSCTAKSCHFDFKLDTHQAKQLKLVALPEIGAILVPKDWRDVEANAGANGTGSALLMSPNQKQAIELYDSSFCVGCGMPYATLYFPNLLKQSIENEYGSYKDPQKLVKVVHPSKQVAFFSYQIPQLNYRTHGVAKYIDEGDFNFRVIKVTLDQSQQHLAGPILNFYHFNH